MGHGGCYRRGLPGKGQQAIPRTKDSHLERLWVKADWKQGGTWQVTPEEAAKLNKQGYGVFWTPNEHHGRRLKANVTKLNYWFCELDQGSKEAQEKRLKDLPVRPSLVIESKRSYHCYWAAADADTETWGLIERGIVRAAKADPAATDPLRLLRVPGFYHQKDKDNPFLVREVWRMSVVYTKAQMLSAFPLPAPKQRGEVPVDGDGFWQRVASIDTGEGILALNGHWLQGHESFALEEQANGNRNVVRVDTDGGNTGTGVFVRPDGSLGHCREGIRLGAWCAWYGWSWGEIAKGLCEVFPELNSEGPTDE